MESPEWRDVIRDTREVQVFEALEDPQWEWRTLGTLCKASGLGPDEVRGILSKYPQFVRKSITQGKSGEELFTLQRRYFERMNPVQKVWTIISGSSSTSTGS